MAFLDDLGKKISHAGQTAAQKTKDMTDVAKLNSSISDEEKRINNNYYQIGKLYVAIHMSDYESDYESMISAIKDAKSKIEEYKQQIQDIKGVVRCVKCGAEVTNGAAFCSSCGAPITKGEEKVFHNVDLVKCTGCGSMVDKTMRFCTSCGKPMVDVTKFSEVKPVSDENIKNEDIQENFIQDEGVQNVEVQEKEVVSTESEENKCPNCGAKMETDMIFCTECGTKIQ